MIVTGVQSVGAKGVNSVQVATVDPKEVGRAGNTADADRDRAEPAKSGVPQPVVFPRKGVPLDQRPVALRQRHATARYDADGGNDHDE